MFFRKKYLVTYWTKQQRNGLFFFAGFCVVFVIFKTIFFHFYIFEAFFLSPSVSNGSKKRLNTIPVRKTFALKTPWFYVERKYLLFRPLSLSLSHQLLFFLSLPPSLPLTFSDLYLLYIISLFNTYFSVSLVLSLSLTHSLSLSLFQYAHLHIHRYVFSSLPLPLSIFPLSLLSSRNSLSHPFSVIIV